MHILRGIYFNSYKLEKPWMVGITILLLSIGVAFVGYVLPWGQMSFWGATVITGLLSTVPYIGDFLTVWLWGGLSVATPTLGRFLTFHFFLPIVLSILVLIHIIFLHSSGSSIPLRARRRSGKLPFHPFFSLKDLLGFTVVFFFIIVVIFSNPDIFIDPENFKPADPSNTPPHIQPEWYFLFAYAILRSIPNKLGGVIALLSSIFVFYFLPYLFKANTPSPLVIKLRFFLFVSVSVLLTWIGSLPVEEPYISIGQGLTLIYFLIIFLPFIFKDWFRKI